MVAAALGASPVSASRPTNQSPAREPIKEENSMHRAIRPLAARNSRGQGMTEYIIIVALIAVAAIGTYNFLGRTVRNQTGAIAAGLAGDQQNATAAHKSAKSAGERAQREAATEKGLQNFADKVGNQ
jgi:Flp pilus assembly pilin Flp